jgi:hypothetical protein
MKNQNTQLTVRDEPAIRAKNTRWNQIADECRNDQGQWRRINKSFPKKQIVQQLSSNIRSSHRRKKPLHGFNPTEKWEATWAESDKTQGVFHVWIRYVGPSK